jgi:hypothetical protein
MNTAGRTPTSESPALTNGSGAAAILSAGIGSFVIAVLSFAGDKSAAIKSSLIFYKPTGALSGVTTLGIVIWLVAWGVLEWRWRRNTVALKRINVVAFVLLGLSFLLTFPPIVDLF